MTEVELRTLPGSQEQQVQETREKCLVPLEHAEPGRPRRQCCDLCNCWIEWAVPSVIAAGVGAVLVHLFAQAYMDTEKWQYTRSVYFTICTMTSLGYGDFAAESNGGRWVTIILIYASATFLMACINYLAGAVVSIGPCIVLNCVSGPFRECLNSSCICMCGEDCYTKCVDGVRQNCKCLGFEEDVEDNLWGIRDAIGERIQKDDYYTELKKHYTVTMFNGAYSSTLSLKKSAKNAEKISFIKFLNDTYGAEFEVESDEKPCCSDVEDLCEHCRLACSPKDCWTFLNITLMYAIWFSIWLGYFTNQRTGACETQICTVEDFSSVDFSNDGNFSVYSNYTNFSEITVYESVLQNYAVSLLNLSCVDLTDVPSSSELKPATKTLGCGDENFCKKKERFDWQLAFYFGVVTSSTVGFGDFSGYGGDFKMSNKQIEFITYMQVPGIILFGAWAAVFGGMYLQLVYALAIYFCCEPRSDNAKCPGCDIRCAWCVTVWDRMYYEKIVEMQTYYRLANGSNEHFTGKYKQIVKSSMDSDEQPKIIEMNFGTQSMFEIQDFKKVRICCKFCNCCVSCAEAADKLQPQRSVDMQRIGQNIDEDLSIKSSRL